ncbi:MAG: rhomboid family intramembrane serine protease [Gemmatimonadota bacterium]|nr:MAG: rhomboid family intramembrane serine protease [Gemmatimonadota bacterium]
MTPWVKRLLLLNGIAYLLTGVVQVIPWIYFAFIPAYIVVRPWTAVTYMFLHAGFWHLGFNMLALFFFGPRLEARLGGRQFLWLYFISGIVGAVLSFAMTPRSPIPIVGASGAVFGVLLGFARYWPREKIYIWGVLPIEARALVIVATMASLYFGFSGGGGNIAHFGHLGGFLGGFLYLLWWDRRSPAARFKAKAQAPIRRSVGSNGTDIKRWQRIDRNDMHPVNQEELDRILDKISADGVDSLTSDERDFLERFSAR